MCDTDSQSLAETGECRFAELLARSIAGRHPVAGLEQLRHHLEFEAPR